MNIPFFATRKYFHWMKEKKMANLVFDAIYEELEYQIRQIEELNKNTRKHKNTSKGRPDYSWLMDAPKSYKISQLAQLEIKEMCKIVKLQDVTVLVQEFRRLVTTETKVDKLPSIMKYVLRQNVSRDGDFLSPQDSDNISGHACRSSSDAMIRDKKLENVSKVERPSSAPSNWKFKKRVSKISPADICIPIEGLDDSGILSECSASELKSTNDLHV